MSIKAQVCAAALALAFGAGTAIAQAPGGGKTSPGSATQQAKPPPKPVEGHITMQSDNTVLASSLIGAQVAGADGEGTAEISDVILRTDGGIEGVVVSVGGFLGLGAHNVAVKWDKIQLQEQPDGKAKLMLTASREDLRAAEKFKSKADVQAERDAAKRSSERPAPVSPGSAPSTR